jgi:hypothetical protein
MVPVTKYLTVRTGWILWHNLSMGKWMTFGTWEVMRLYRTSSLKMVAKELGQCKLDLVGV